MFQYVVEEPLSQEHNKALKGPLASSQMRVLQIHYLRFEKQVLLDMIFPLRIALFFHEVLFKQEMRR